MRFVVPINPNVRYSQGMTAWLLVLNLIYWGGVAATFGWSASWAGLHYSVKGTQNWWAAKFLNRLCRWPATGSQVLATALGFLPPWTGHNAYWYFSMALNVYISCWFVKAAWREHKNDDDWFGGWKKRMKRKIQTAVQNAKSKVSVGPVPVMQRNLARHTVG